MAFEPIHSSRLNKIAFGSIQLTGALAKDSYIEIAPNSELTSESQDAGSYNTSISVLSDNSALVTIQLQAQSVANAALARIVRDDKNNNTKTIADISIVSGGTLYLYDLVGCYIKARPTETKSEDMASATNTWVFYCSDLREKDLDGFDFNDDIKAGITGSVEATIDLRYEF